MDLDMKDRWFSVLEIAHYLGVSKETIYRWVDSKGIPAHKVGKQWKFKTEDVDEWVRNGKLSRTTPKNDTKGEHVSQ